MKLKENIAISESGFLFDPSTGESYNLNKTGRLVIKLLSEEKKEDDLIKEIKASYDIEEQNIRRYLDDFFGMLQQFHLVEENDS